jgi:hypothetical protein
MLSAVRGGKGARKRGVVRGALGDSVNFELGRLNFALDFRVQNSEGMSRFGRLKSKRLESLVAKKLTALTARRHAPVPSSVA